MWSRDSHELFYLDAVANMVAVPVVTGPRFERGTAQVVFNAGAYFQNPFFPQYDVTADGKRFVMIRGDASAVVRVVAVFNFFEEIARVMREDKN